MPHANTMDDHVNNLNGVLMFSLDKAIVVDIIGGLLFDPKESKERRRERRGRFRSLRRLRTILASGASTT